MDTHFASAERATDDALTAEIRSASDSPVVSGLLHSISGLLAILNTHRQIVAVNDSLLDVLGIDDPGEALGLRPGEALGCVHANDEPAGCGTTKWCSTCGAAIAIVSSLGQDRPVERICALSAKRGVNKMDIALLVRSHPLEINGSRFLLLFLQDITQQEQRAALERTFFHDANNILSMLVGAADILVEREPSELARTIQQSALRLVSEVSVQRCLAQSNADSYQPIRHEVTPGQALEELRAFFTTHPAAHMKKIEFQKDVPAIPVYTDMSLLFRILCNMILNALEATDQDGHIKVWSEREGDRLSYCVWNARKIPREIAQRIFQRNFSTKAQDGRGVGTYSMKLFGEKILGGRVSFATDRDKGTVFRFSLPL